jgi:hypothetical protein
MQTKRYFKKRELPFQVKDNYGIKQHTYDLYDGQKLICTGVSHAVAIKFTAHKQA